VGQACESAAARQVARRVGLAESTVRAIDLRYLERWEARRRQPPLRQMGVDEIYRVLSASLRSGTGLETVALRHPVMPIADGLGCGFVGIDGSPLR